MSMYDNEIPQDNSNLGGLRVTNEMKRRWLATSKWAKFFAIIGFVGVGLSVLLLGSLGVIFQTLGNLSGNYMLTMMLAPMLTYITGFAAVGLLVQAAYHYYHLRFANDMKKALHLTDQAAFEQSWRSLRNHFRIFGILVVVALAFALVALTVIGYTMSLPSGGESFPME